MGRTSTKVGCTTCTQNGDARVRYATFGGACVFWRLGAYIEHKGHFDRVGHYTGTVHLSRSWQALRVRGQRRMCGSRVDRGAVLQML